MTCIRCNHGRAKRFGHVGRQRVQRWRCTECSATFCEPREKPLGDMRIDPEKAIQALKCLVEGCSLRSTQRLTGLDRGTLGSLLLLAGGRCAKLMDERMRGLKSKVFESDEIWGYVFKKQRHVLSGDPAEFGDQWIFIALDADSKLIPTFVVGKRTVETTQTFISDLARRVSGRIQITTDGFHFYVDAVENAFGADVDFAQLVKLFGNFGQHDNGPEARYSPPGITEVISKVRQGRPDSRRISTSYVERQNLTVRMAIRRFTRLTNAFSKKLDFMKAACALHFAHYNFCRIHTTLRVTPAMEAGIADHIWEFSELLGIATL